MASWEHGLFISADIRVPWGSFLFDCLSCRLFSTTSSIVEFCKYLILKVVTASTPVASDPVYAIGMTSGPGISICAWFRHLSDTFLASISPCIGYSALHYCWIVEYCPVSSCLTGQHAYGVKRSGVRLMVSFSRNVYKQIWIYVVLW